MFFVNPYEGKILDLYRAYRESVAQAKNNEQAAEELGLVVARISDVMLFCDRLVFFLDDAERLAGIWAAVTEQELDWRRGLSPEELVLLQKACESAGKRFPRVFLDNTPDKMELFKQTTELVWQALQHYLFTKSSFWRLRKLQPPA